MPARLVPKAASGRVAAALIVLLALCEVVILSEYVGAIQRSTELTLELEYARGASLIANARAEQCWARSEPR